MSKGQVVFFGLMLGITIIVLALALAPTVKTFTDGARNETDVLGGQGLNCTSESLSWADEGACLITDMSLPYFVIGLMAIGGMYFGAKFIAENA
jgi:hypothetical protein